MSWLKQLLGLSKFRKHADTFALTRSVVNEQLKQWVQSCVQRKQHVLLLAHFPATFEQMERSLGEADIQYEIIARQILADQFNAAIAQSDPIVWLTLPDVLIDSIQPRELNSQDSSLAVIVTERHPLVERDQRIERFARSLRGRIELGYFLSLEDPVVRQVVNPRSIELLKQLGLGQNDLISSHMTSRIVERMLRRISEQVSNEQPADSPEQWFELNLPADVAH